MASLVFGARATRCRRNLTMPTQRDRDNDRKLLTPLLLMALAIACGFLFTAYSGHMLLAQG